MDKPNSNYYINMKGLQQLLFAALLSGAIILNSCAQSHQQVIAAQPGEFQKTLPLGNTEYSIELPDSFRIEEANGKEGQLGFSIIPLNENSNMHGFIEILKGNPHLANDETKKEVFCKSVLNGESVTWTIYKTETDYLYAESSEVGELSATAVSKDKTEVELLIRIISTLKMKD